MVIYHQQMHMQHFLREQMIKQFQFQELKDLSHEPCGQSFFVGCLIRRIRDRELVVRRIERLELGLERSDVVFVDQFIDGFLGPSDDSGSAGFVLQLGELFLEHILVAVESFFVVLQKCGPEPVPDIDLKLVALNARTGAVYPNFGENGYIDLTQGYSREIDASRMTYSSPVAIAGDTIIAGSVAGSLQRQARNSGRSVSIRMSPSWPRKR